MREPIETRSVLYQERSIRHGQCLVETEDRPVSEAAERLSVEVAQERQRAILDEEHPARAAQVRKQ